MSVKTRTKIALPAKNTSREDVLWLARTLSFADQNWLMEQLGRLAPLEDDHDDELPESTTLDGAIELYLTDKCSLGRAAELAGVTRWHIMDVLKERHIPIIVDRHLSAEEIDELAEELELSTNITTSEAQFEAGNYLTLDDAVTVAEVKWQAQEYVA